MGLRLKLSRRWWEAACVSFLHRSQLQMSKAVVWCLIWIAPSFQILFWELLVLVESTSWPSFLGELCYTRGLGWCWQMGQGCSCWFLQLKFCPVSFLMLLYLICNIQSRDLEQGGDKNCNSLSLIFLSQSQDNVGGKSSEHSSSCVPLFHRACFSLSLTSPIHVSHLPSHLCRRISFYWL
jgi:hypothetical protein